jgi:hypothetical protein
MIIEKIKLTNTLDKRRQNAGLTKQYPNAGTKYVPGHGKDC